MNQHTETIRTRYDRTAKWYDFMEHMFSPELRRKVLAPARGEALEVGVGTGKNLLHYPPGCRVTGIDFSAGMLARAQAKAAQAPVPVTLLQMDAQEMSFADASFDTVVATCVFCSVPDPIKGLHEVRRVCRPGGQIILLEHIRSDHPLLGRIMDWLNPFSLYLVGSNINRRTVENVERAGLIIEHIDDVNLPIVKLIKARP